MFDQLERANSTDEVASQARGYLAQYLTAYERYFEKEPDHYRARMHYAYLLILDADWGGDRANEALEVVQNSYELSPQNPTTYVVEIMARAYLADFTGAEGILAELKTLSPSITLTKDTEAWLAKQKQIAPRHSFLRISNI